MWRLATIAGIPVTSIWSMLLAHTSVRPLRKTPTPSAPIRPLPPGHAFHGRGAPNRRPDQTGWPLASNRPSNSAELR